jgi:hypothetical protein
MHEPLILALFFPYVRCKPWELKRSPKLVEVERVLRGMLKEPFFAATLQVLSRASRLVGGVGVAVVTKPIRPCPSKSHDQKTTKVTSGERRLIKQDSRVLGLEKCCLLHFNVIFAGL